MPRKLDSAFEAVLIERSRRQDDRAFAQIVDAYQSRVFGFVRRMTRNEEDALDVTQEVFVRAFKAMRRFDGRASLRTWLFRIAHNLCIDRIRKSERALQETSIEPMHEDEEPFDSADSRWDPERVALDDELQHIVEQAVGSMSEKLKTVLILHDREEMPHDEIAETIGIPVGTVKSRLFLARAHVQEHVARYLQGVTS